MRRRTEALTEALTHQRCLISSRCWLRRSRKSRSALKHCSAGAVQDWSFHREREGEGLLVDRRHGAERRNGAGGQRWTKNKRWMSRVPAVSDRCDEEAGAQAAIQVEKPSLCDADDNAISRALSRMMGCAPGDTGRRTLIRRVCVLQARS